MVKAAKHTILQQQRRAKLQAQKSKISKMPKISLPNKKPTLEVMVKQEAEEVANTYRFDHESSKTLIKTEYIKQEIKTEISPRLQVRRMP